MKGFDEPFGLPRGSVRAFLTVVLVGITAAVMFIPIPAGKDDVKSMFVLLTGIAVRDYFASRENARTGVGRAETEGSRLPGPHGEAHAPAA